MIGSLAAALGCFVIGFIAAWLLRTARAQQHRERHVRYWPGQARHARAVAEHLLQQFEAHTEWPREPIGWPGHKYELPTPAAELIIWMVPTGRFVDGLSWATRPVGAPLTTTTTPTRNGCDGGSLGRN